MKDMDSKSWQNVLSGSDREFFDDIMQRISENVVVETRTTAAEVPYSYITFFKEALR